MIIHLLLSPLVQRGGEGEGVCPGGYGEESGGMNVGTIPYDTILAVVVFMKFIVIWLLNKLQICIEVFSENIWENSFSLVSGDIFSFYRRGNTRSG